MSTCRRCNRTLKREPYRSLGIGKICSAKEKAESEKQYNVDGTYVPYDGGDVFLERLPGGGIRTNVSHREVKHSPTGLEFGYGGSGPADTALNILLMFTDRETAHNHYQEFKWLYVATGQRDKLVIPKESIMKFLEQCKALVV